MSPLLADAREFPVDLHVPERRYGVLRIDDDVLARSSFLDTRIEAPLADARPLSVDDVPSALPSARVGWLFHTSFCGSTLAARALHVPPHSVCLREPLVLRRLGDARHGGWSLDGLIAPTLRLLSRPWHDGSAVVIKPTHAALNLAIDLVQATPDSRGVVLTSSLDDFLVSNLKKTPESQAKIPQLAERALRVGTFASRLPPAALQPPDLLCAAALQWAAQRECMVDLVQASGGRVRTLDMSWLLDDLAGAMAQTARWLQLDIPEQVLRSNCQAQAARNAKAIASPYDSQQRAREAMVVTQMFRDPLARTRVWADSHLLPAMRPTARATPEPWTA